MNKTNANVSAFIFASTTVLLLSAASTNVYAQSDEINQCRLLQDNVKRLDCFDNLFGRPYRKQSTKRLVEEPSPSVPAQTKAQQNISSPESSFGAEALSVEAPETIDEIQASVTNRVDGSRGYSSVTLDNGQIWKQKDRSRFIVKAGDTIVIKKGTFGSYLLSKTTSNRTSLVKRIK